jgi:hypothetical protein
MSINDLPDDEKSLMNVVAKAGYFQAENNKIKISLESADTLDIQPKGTVFGAKVKVENDGSLSPSLTFDTKKLRDEGRYIPPKQLIDDALKDFWGEENV